MLSYCSRKLAVLSSVFAMGCGACANLASVTKSTEPNGLHVLEMTGDVLVVRGRAHELAAKECNGANVSEWHEANTGSVFYLTSRFEYRCSVP